MTRDVLVDTVKNTLLDDKTRSVTLSKTISLSTNEATNRMGRPKLSTKHLRVTAKDIAKAAGVSQATVSMALRGSPEIGEKRIEQIRKLAEEMNYHPRAAAQLLRSRTSGQMGIIVGASNAVQAFSTGFTGPLVGSLIDVYVGRGTRYVIEFHSHVDDEMWSKQPPPYQISSGLVDGSIIVGDVGIGLSKMLGQGFPNYPRVSIDEPSAYCVLNDSRKGVADVVEKFYKLGHTRLAYTCGPQRYLTHHEGLNGFVDTAKQLKLRVPEDRVLVIDTGFEGSAVFANETMKWARKVLSEPNRPTGIICHDGTMARAVIHAATELGLKIPKDLSVTSWGWHLHAQEQFPALATVEFDFRAMVKSAVEMLDSLIQGEEIANSKVVIPPKFIDGSTVAGPPGG
ncbi:MAG: LacI family DNA-binding transcriptional regulator [Pirellulales bacterium]